MKLICKKNKVCFIVNIQDALAKLKTNEQSWLLALWNTVLYVFNHLCDLVQAKYVSAATVMFKGLWWIVWL